MVSLFQSMSSSSSPRSSEARIQEEEGDTHHPKPQKAAGAQGVDQAVDLLISEDVDQRLGELATSELGQQVFLGEAFIVEPDREGLERPYIGADGLRREPALLLGSDWMLLIAGGLLLQRSHKGSSGVEGQIGKPGAFANELGKA